MYDPEQHEENKSILKQFFCKFICILIPLLFFGVFGGISYIIASKFKLGFFYSLLIAVVFSVARSTILGNINRVELERSSIDQRLESISNNIEPPNVLIISEVTSFGGNSSLGITIYEFLDSINGFLLDNIESFEPLYNDIESALEANTSPSFQLNIDAYNRYIIGFELGTYNINRIMFRGNNVVTEASELYTHSYMLAALHSLSPDNANHYMTELIENVQISGDIHSIQNENFGLQMILDDKTGTTMIISS